MEGDMTNRNLLPAQLDLSASHHRMTETRLTKLDILCRLRSLCRLPAAGRRLAEAEAGGS